VNVLGYFKELKPGESGEKTLCYEREEKRKPPRFRVLKSVFLKKANLT
jgi:hypothetical protein